MSFALTAECRGHATRELWRLSKPAVFTRKSNGVGNFSRRIIIGKFALKFEFGMIAAGDVIQTDGSGLSRHDLVTPRAIVALLKYAQGQPWFATYFASLPVAGIDGTLETLMKNTPSAGHIHAKTGSVEHVRTRSGFAE